MPKDLHLPQIEHPAPPRAKLRKWRAASLIAVNLLIVGHILHYTFSGRSLTPAVMSESMRTIELGQVTCGVLMFGLAILTSLLFGRFICGWACHMGSLQDGTAWLMKKAGLKPQPIRARWLAWAPFAAAFYLFAWPTLKREALIPLADRWWPAAADILGRVAPRPDGFTLQLVTDDFWAGLPRWQIAVPFLLICGVASVFFLGSRGVCRYVCPYSGLLDPAARLAPVAVTVDPSLCDSCGLCTKACDVGVRVMEETAALGRVVSSRCIRSLDCVAACPHGALSLRPARPALTARLPDKARPLYSLSLGEEAGVTVAALAAFFTLRGAYDSVPLLMAVGASACVGGIALWTIRLIRKPAVSIMGHTVKAQRRLSLSGYAVLGAAAVAAALLIHTAAVRIAIHRAGTLDDAVTVSADEAFAGRSPAAQKDLARRALAAYSSAMSIDSGGFALLDTPSAKLRMAWLALAAGDPQQAERHLTAVIDKEGPTDSTLIQRARIMLSSGRRDQAKASLIEAATRRPSLTQAAAAGAAMLKEDGAPDKAASLLTACRDARPWDASTHANLAEFQLSIGNAPAALDGYRAAAAIKSAPPEVRARYLVVECAAGDRARAETTLHAWHTANRDAAAKTAAVAAAQLQRFGRTDAADRLTALAPR